MGKKILNILAVDDDESVLENLEMDAPDSGCKVYGSRSLEGLKKSIAEYGWTHFDGIILDVLCLLTEDQSIESREFITKALEYIDAECPDLPRVICTADDYSFIVGDIHPNEKIFLKGQLDYQDLFEYLKKEQKNRPTRRIKLRHAEVFDTLDKSYFSSNIQDSLINLYKCMHLDDPKKVHDNLTEVRRLLEALFIALRRKNKNWCPPTDSNKKGEPSIVDMAKHLQEIGLVPRHSYEDLAIRTINKAGSSGGAHEDPDATLSHEKVQACIYLLMDLIRFFGKKFDQL